MINEESGAPGVYEPKTSTAWEWLWPTVAAVVIVKFFGLVGGLVTFGVHYWLKPKLGTWVAVGVACVAGVVAAIAFAAMVRA